MREDVRDCEERGRRGWRSWKWHKHRSVWWGERVVVWRCHRHQHQRHQLTWLSFTGFVKIEGSFSLSPSNRWLSESEREGYWYSVCKSVTMMMNDDGFGCLPSAISTSRRQSFLVLFQFISCRVNYNSQSIYLRFYILSLLLFFPFGHSSPRGKGSNVTNLTRDTVLMSLVTKVLLLLWIYSINFFLLQYSINFFDTIRVI